jgi:hypothetical protein
VLSHFEKNKIGIELSKIHHTSINDTNFEHCGIELMVEGLGSAVWSSGFKVHGLRLRV